MPALFLAGKRNWTQTTTDETDRNKTPFSRVVRVGPCPILLALSPGGVAAKHEGGHGGPSLPPPANPWYTTPSAVRNAQSPIANP